MKTSRIEPLESRIAPATLVALSDSDTLLRFSDTTPGTVVTTTLTGHGAGEDFVGIDFRPADGRLYGLTIDGSNAGRLYAIEPATGVASLVAFLTADPADATNPFTALSGASFGLDFNPVVNRLRVVSDTGQNLRINSTSGFTITDSTLNPGTPGVEAAAYTNSFLGTTSTTLYVIDPTTDQLLIQNPPNNGVLGAVGSLGVNATGAAGFDILYAGNTALAALTVGGEQKLYRVALATGAVTDLGAIGTGTTPVRGLAIVPPTWDGDTGLPQLNNAGNWASGLVPVAGDSLIFPAGPANKTVVNTLPNLTALEFVRFDGDGYTVSSSSAARITGGIFVTHITGTTNFTQTPVFGVQNGAAATVDVSAGATLVLTQPSLDGTQGLNFTGGGTIDMFSLTSPVDAGTNIVVNGPAVTIDFLNTNRAVALQAGSLTVGKVTGQTRFAPVTVTGGTLLGDGDLGAVTVTSGTIVTDALGLTVNGTFSLGAGATGQFDLPAAPEIFAGLEVKGTVTLAGALDLNVAATTVPPSITLIANDGTDPVNGTFSGLAEGATITLLGRTFTLSYEGGDGNDVTLTGASAPIVIAPGGKSATFTDVDGDLVTVAITKGDLNDAVFSLRDAGGGRAQFELLDFRGDTTFAGTNLTFSARRQGPAGDGRVNVGFIDATNLDLGTVSVPGDLGAIDAGDATPATLALRSLAVQSLGVFGVTTGAPDLESDLDGRVGSIVIRGDLRDASIQVFDRTKDTGDRGGGSSGDGEAFINSLTIGGNLIGGAGVDSGSILVRDGIVKATIGGSIVGGTGLLSGRISSFDGLGNLTIGGSVVGGSGNSSGQINASTEAVENLSVRGSVIGGSGANSGALSFSDFDNDRPSGSFFLGGSLIGGAGQTSGEIDFDGPVKKATIAGDILGGSGQFSARVEFEEFVGTFLLGGSVVAGDANFTAQLGFEKSAGSVTILGSIVGREGTFSAQVEVDDDLGKLTLGGSVIGGGQGSGQFDVGNLKSGTIRGNVVGGPGSDSGRIDAEGIGSLTVGSFLGGPGVDSGTLGSTEPIGTLKVLGSLVGGSGDRSGQVSLFSAGVRSLEVTGSLLAGTGATSGSLLIGGALGQLKVGGEIRGTADDPVTISGGGIVPSGGTSAIGLGSVQVAGGVTHARFLAGYDSVGVARNADAVIGSVTVGGDWVASSLVAGLVAGADTFFGTADDALISGSGTTNNAALSSRIGSVAIKGQVLGTPAAGGGFGIAAQQIGSLKAGAVSFPFTANADAFVLGATGDFQARELGAANPVAGPAGPAPTLVNGTTVTFTDVDGDLVTVKVTKGTLDLAQNFIFAPSGVGQQLQRLVLAATEFDGASVTITAKRSATSGGDGSVNVGAIDATGFDLGKVTVAGDLGVIDVGDAATGDGSLGALAVQSFGTFGLLTGAPDLFSNFNGRVTSLAVRGDVQGARLVIEDTTVGGNGTLGALSVGGSIVGGATANTGTIQVVNDLLKLTIGGNLIGGSGGLAGAVEVGRNLGAASIRGSLVGGAGASSGYLGTIGGPAQSVTVGGSIFGGANASSGAISLGAGGRSVAIGGSIFGGTEQNSGMLSTGGAVGKVTLGGDLVGGAGLGAGSMEIRPGRLGSATIRGSVFGGAGEQSGRVEAQGGIGALTVGGALIAGSGESSAEIDGGDEDLKSFTLGGSIIGYRGTSGSGGLDAGRVTADTLGTVAIGGSVIGGRLADSAFILGRLGVGQVTLGGSLIGGEGARAGSVLSNADLTSLTVRGSVFGGGGAQSGSVDVARDGGGLTIGGSVFSGGGALSGSLRSGSNLGRIAIGGHIFGTEARAVQISAVGDAQNAVAIAGLSVAGGARFLDVLAGYDDAAPTNGGASLGAVSIGGDLIASNLVAGVAAGADGDFGTADDVAIAGGTAISRLASILVRGQLLGTVGGTDAFGFVAQQIGSLQVGAISYPLTAAPNEILGLGATGDFSAREDV